MTSNPQPRCSRVWPRENCLLLKLVIAYRCVIYLSSTTSYHDSPIFIRASCTYATSGAAALMSNVNSRLLSTMYCENYGCHTPCWRMLICSDTHTHTLFMTVSIHGCPHVYTYVHTYVRMCVCEYVCVYVCR